MALDQRYQAGTAWVKVSPDFRGWQKKMREQVKNASEDYLTRVSLDLDTKEARAALREFEANDANVTANVKVDKKDLARARTQLDSLDKDRRVISVRTEVDNDRIRQQIKGLDKQFRDVAFRPDIKINDKSINKQFDKLRQRVAKMSNAGGVVDSKAYKNALDSAARLDAIENERLRASKQRESIEKSINDESEQANERYNKVVRERTGLNREAKRIQDDLAKSTADIVKLENESAKYAERKAELAEREAQAKKDVRQHERALSSLDRDRDRAHKRLGRNREALPDVQGRITRMRPVGNVAEWDIEHRIIQAFKKLNKEGNGPVDIADLRKKVGGSVSRADFDNAIRRIDKRKGASAYPSDDPKSLTNGDRANAVRIGDREAHKLSLAEGYRERVKPRAALSEANKADIAREKKLNAQIEADEAEIARLTDERKKIRAAIDAAKKREKRATTSAADIGDGSTQAADLRAAKQRKIDNEKALLKTQGKLENSVEDLSDAYEDLERVRSKGNQRELQELSAIDRQLDRLTKSRDAAKRVLDRSERELEQRRGVGADRTAKIRRPSLESSDTDTGTDHVARVNSAIHRAGIGNSPLASDIAAMRDARVAAAALDSELARLARANSDLSRTERDVAVATAEVNRHRENGTITSDKGIAAVERETRALEKYHSVANTIQVTSQKVNRLRGDYNRMAGTLGSRLNENGIRRFADTLDHRISQAVTKATSRVVLLGRVFSSVATLAGASAVGFAALGAVNLVPLVGTLSQVAGTLGILPGLAAAAATAIAAIGIGMSGITSAFKAGTALDDATGAGGGGADNSKSIRSAQKALDKAHKDVGKTAAQGAEQIADAEKNVQQAQKDSVKAQKDLTNARKDAIQQAEDLKDAVDGIALSERDAQLSVEEAAKRMREVNADPDSDSLDRRRAKLSYDQAVEAQKNLRKENQKTRAEYAETQRKGVEGSDQVVEAQDRVKEAQQGIVDAQKDLVKTQQDAADANADALDRVADAQESLADAMNGGSSGGGPTPLDKFNAELDKLAPNAQGLVVGLRSLKDEWTDLRKSTQQSLFHGVAEDVMQLAEKYFPLLKKGLGDVADGLNGGFRHFFTYLKSEKGYADFTSIFKNSGAAMGDLSVATSNFLQALGSVAEVGTRFMPWFGRSLADTAKNWRSMADDAQGNGSMEAFFVRAINRSKQLGRIFYDLGSIIKNTFAATSDLGSDSLLHIEQSLDAYAKKLQSATGQNGVREFFQGVRDMLHNSAQILGSIAQLVSQHLVPAFQIINSVLGPITQSLAAMSTAIGQIPVLGAGIKYLVAAMLALKIASAAGGFAGKIGDKVSPAAMAGLRSMRTTIAGIGSSSATAATNVGRIGTAAANATTPAMRLAAAVDKVRGGPYAGSSARLGIAGQIGAIAGPANTATGAMGRLQGSLGKVQSIGTTAFSKVKSSAKNAVDFLGGPVGIAITGVVVGLSLWYSSTQQINSANRQLADTMNRVAASAKKASQSIIDARGGNDPEVASNYADLASNMDQERRDRLNAIKSKTDGWSGTGYSLGQFFSGNWGNISDSTIGGLKNDRDKIQSQIDVLNKLKISSEDVGTAISGTDAQWTSFSRMLMNEGSPAAQQVLRDYQGQRDEFVRIQAAVQDLTPGYLDLRDALKDLSDKTISASDATEALRKAFRALNPATTKLEALGNFGDMIDEMRQKIQSASAEGGFGIEQLLSPNGELDTTKQNANTLFKMMEDGFANIGAAAKNGAEIGPLWAQFTDQLYAFGDAVGISRDDMDQLLKRMRLTPDAIRTTISVEGADTVEQTLTNIKLLADAADARGEPRKIKMEIPDTKVRDALTAMGLQLNAIAGQPNMVEIDLQDNGTYQKLLLIQGTLEGSRKEWWDLESAVSLGANGQVIITNNTPEVRAALDALKLQTQTLPDGTIVLKPESAQFWHEVQSAIAPATKDITFKYYDEDGKEIPAGLAALRPGQFKRTPVAPGNYLGGRLPMFARGGRMPTSGPGTEKRDGFLAVGPDGKPQARVDGGEWIINDAMSEKYNGLLSLINADRLQGYAGGGRMGAQAAGNQGAFGLGVIGNPFANMASGVMGLGAAFGDALGTAIPEWQRFGNTLSSTASKFISPALSGVNSAIDEMGTDFPLITQTKIIPPWSQMSTFLSNQKTSVLDPMFAGIQTSATAMGLWFGSMASRVQPTWLSMATQLMAAKTGTIDPVFNGIESGLTTVEQAFATAVPSIAAQWNGMREATAAPVRFTINTVFNDGLIATWNSVADLTGAKKMTGKPAAFARGGVLPGYTPGRDVHKFFSPTGGELHLSGGEAVMRPEWVRAQGGPSAIDKMNAAARQGTPQKVKNSKTGSDYADGGTVAVGYGLPPGSSVSYGAPGFPDWVYALGRAHGVQPSTYPGHQESDRGEAGYAPNPQHLNRGIDWSGPVNSMQAFAQYLLGIAPSTPTLEQIIWQNPSTGQQIGWHGRVPDIGGGYFAADYPGHTDHVHTRQSGPIAPGAVASALGSSTGMALGAVLDTASVIRSMLDPKLAETQKKITATKFGGVVGGVPQAAFDSAKKPLVDKAIELAKNTMASMAGPGAANYLSGANIPGDVAEKVRKAFELYGWGSGAEWEAAKWIITHESGWNPTAVNPSSGAWGLFQFLGATKDNYYPTNDPDPYKQGQAGAKYMKDRYGTPSAAKAFWQAHNWYDRGGMWPTGTTGINMSGKPEAVFTNPQWKMLEKLVESLLNPKMFRALTDQKKVSLGRTPAADGTVPLGSQQTAQREYTPAWEDPDTKAPYITDPETGVPIDPKTNKAFTEDPDTHKPITKDDKTGLYIDPRTGKYFYGSDASDLDAKATTGADAPKRSYTPAWTDKDGKPYEVDPVTGVPIDPTTGKPFTEDPESHSDIKLDDTTGLYVDPKTGSYFYGSKAKDLDAQDGNKQGDPNAALDPANQFSFDDPNNPDGTPDDWTENYTGPFSDIIKKGKLLGQLGNALIQPGAIQRIGNDAEMNKQIDLAKTREEALNTYKTEQAQKISELRAAGKTEEAAALEKESRAKIAGMKELPGSSPGTQAMLATMEKNPSETWKKQSAQQWQSWLGENWAGIAESAAVVGAQGAGQVSGGLTVMGDLNTGDGFHTVLREMDRREARQSRANSRRGRR